MQHGYIFIAQLLLFGLLVKNKNFVADFFLFRTPAVIYNFTSLCRLIVHQNPDLLLKHKKKYVNDYFFFRCSFLFIYIYLLLLFDLNVFFQELSSFLLGSVVNRFLFSLVVSIFFGVQLHLEVSMTGFFLLLLNGLLCLFVSFGYCIHCFIVKYLTFSVPSVDQQNIVGSSVQDLCVLLFFYSFLFSGVYTFISRKRCAHKTAMFGLFVAIQSHRDCCMYERERARALCNAPISSFSAQFLSCVYSCAILQFDCGFQQIKFMAMAKRTKIPYLYSLKCQTYFLLYVCIHIYLFIFWLAISFSLTWVFIFIRSLESWFFSLSQWIPSRHFSSSAFAWFSHIFKVPQKKRHRINFIWCRKEFCICLIFGFAL